MHRLTRYDVTQIPCCIVSILKTIIQGVAKQATSGSRRLLTILNHHEWVGEKHLIFNTRAGSTPRAPV